MLELSFTDSACGSLKQAQHYGEGAYLGGATGIIGSHEDGSAFTCAEIEAFEQAYEAKEREAWAHATPLGGQVTDIYGFAFVLSIGDISEDIPDKRRAQALDLLYRIYPNFEDESTSESLLKNLQPRLTSLLTRIENGEPLRIWYSNQPDEICGMYWFTTLLKQHNLQNKEIFSVKLPKDSNTLQPNEWAHYAKTQTRMSADFLHICAKKWQLLQQENAPLRACVNGQLVSVPETFYDSFILQEIEASPNRFHEAQVIGTVLTKYKLGIGDAWIAHRIETFIAAGIVTPAGKADSDSPIYHRYLNKTKEGI